MKQGQTSFLISTFIIQQGKDQLKPTSHIQDLPPTCSWGHVQLLFVFWINDYYRELQNKFLFRFASHFRFKYFLCMCFCYEGITKNVRYRHVWVSNVEPVFPTSLPSSSSSPPLELSCLSHLTSPDCLSERHLLRPSDVWQISCYDEPKTHNHSTSNSKEHFSLDIK